MSHALRIYLELAGRAKTATDPERVDILHNLMDEAWHDLSDEDRNVLDGRSETD